MTCLTRDRKTASEITRVDASIPYLIDAPNLLGRCGPDSTDQTPLWESVRGAAGDVLADSFFFFAAFERSAYMYLRHSDIPAEIRCAHASGSIDRCDENN